MSEQKDIDDWSLMAIQRIAAMCVEDILSMSDEEILAEVLYDGLYDGEDPEKIAEEGRAIVACALAVVARRRSGGQP